LLFLEFQQVNINDSTGFQGLRLNLGSKLRSYCIQTRLIDNADEAKIGGLVITLEAIRHHLVITYLCGLSSAEVVQNAESGKPVIRV
jgi:hypothetical protein